MGARSRLDPSRIRIGFQMIVAIISMALVALIGFVLEV